MNKFIILPWPAKELNPNQRMHWSKLHKAKRNYRFACMMSALDQGIKPMTDHDGSKIKISMTFVPPDKRRRDTDNLIASMKAGIDGIAQALQVDDVHFDITYKMAESAKLPMVEVEFI